MATNPQGLPFFSPLLPGVPRPTCLTPNASFSNPKNEKNLDFLILLLRIRELYYASSAAFLQDIRTLVQTVKYILQDSSEPLTQASETILMVTEEQFRTHAEALARADAAVAKDKSKKGNKKRYRSCTIDVWKVHWRQECSPFGNTSFLRIDEMNVQEWTDYILHTPPLKSTPKNASSTQKRSASARSNGIPTELQATLVRCLLLLYCSCSSTCILLTRVYL